MARIYTVSEINRMRIAVIRTLPKLESQAERLAAAEDRLRTYMTNGTDPDDLETDAQMRRDAVRELDD